MTWVIAGLGNPGDEYTATRHNAGRMALDFFAKKMEFGEWRDDAKAKARVSRGVIGKTPTILIEPDTFMNKSGSAIAKYVKSVKAAEHLIVVHDDLDLPIGSIKLSFDRGAGGNHGVESVMRAIKTKKFTRIRIGVSPSTAGGKLKKPSGEDEVVDFILAKFKPAEMDVLKKIFAKSAEAMQKIVEEGVLKAMNVCN